MRLVVLGGLIGVAILLGGCGNVPLPPSARASVTAAGPPIEPTPHLMLVADVGGGCNVEGPYRLSTDVDLGVARATVTITGHDYDSDGDECAEVASAVAEVVLPPLPDGDRYEVEVVLSGASTVFVVEHGASVLIATETAPDPERIVALSCSSQAENPATGCTVSTGG